MRLRIYLADLGHNLLTLSSDVYPLGIANLATYARARLEGRAQLEISIFREPQDLKRALDNGAPDLLGLSNYAWNEELSNHFAGYAKARSPETVVVMGGPNYPLVDSVRGEFLAALPKVDAYIDGPTYEGERAFVNLLERLIESKGRAGGLREGQIPGIDWFDHARHEFHRGGEVERIRDLDEIPSPYLAGLMEPYLRTGYFPMMQISRGCPFTCAFCNSGVRSNSRVFAHSVENVKADLAYLAERVKPEITLCFADDNFGMYERDVELADYIGWLQDSYGWPRYIRTTTGKNKGERIIQVMRKIKGALPMTAAVQSMNPVVLKNIKRDNIKLETYREIQKELESQGMQSYGELILCLPGESKQSFLKAVEDLLDAGAKRISAHQLMLLHGAELANPEERAKFDAVIDRYLAEHPDIVNVGLFRIEDLAEYSGTRMTILDAAPRDMLSPVEDAAGEIEQARLVGMQLVWLASRLPNAAGWEAQTVVDQTLSSEEFNRLSGSRETLGKGIQSHDGTIKSLAKDLDAVAVAVDGLGTEISTLGAVRAMVHDALLAIGGVLAVAIVAGAWFLHHLARRIERRIGRE